MCNFLDESGQYKWLIKPIKLINFTTTHMYIKHLTFLQSISLCLQEFTLDVTENLSPTLRVNKLFLPKMIANF